MGIETYSTVANDNNNAAPNGWPEGMAALDVNNSARQNMADTRTQWNDAEWFEFRDGTPDGPASFVANNQFKIVSVTSVDVTGHWHVGRRVQIINAGTFFATITATSFSVDTTTVTIDSTPLTNTTLVALSSIIPAVNSPLPIDQTFDTITASTGIELGGTGAANTLDDYEEGTWTPVQSGVSLTATAAKYTKIGRLVTVFFDITWPSTSDTTNVALTGLPFSIVDNSGNGIAGFTTNATLITGITVTSALKLYNRAGTPSTQQRNIDLSLKRVILTLSYEAS